MTGHTPPHDQAAEMAVLGVILRAGDSDRDTAAQLVEQAPDPGDYYKPQHERLAAHLVVLAGDGRPLDPATVLGALGDAGDLKPGWLDGPYLHRLVETAAPVSSVAYLADRIRALAQRRNALTSLRQATQRLEQADPDDDGAALFEAMDVLEDAVGGQDRDQVGRGVAAELRRLRDRAEARRLFDAEQQAAAEMPPFDAALLGDILDRPPEPPQRVDGLLPTDGALALVAQRKTGKTTWLLNLARDLIIGGLFLGEFEARPITGNVTILNYEVTGRQLAQWAHDAGIPRDRLLLVNLRGRRNPLAYTADRAAMVELLKAHRTETLIVDPFGRAYSGQSQNDPGEVLAWLDGLDRLAADAGAAETILAVHAGWFAERTRGASSIEDWADVIVTLTRDDKDGDHGPRYMRAIGRDVDIDEDRLHYDPRTRCLTLTGAGSRQQAQRRRALTEAKAAVTDYVTANPGCSGQDIRDNIDGRNSTLDRARRELVAAGTLTEARRRGRGGGKAYYPTPSNSDNPGTTPTPPNPARGDVPNPAPPPLYEGRGSGGEEHGDATAGGVPNTKGDDAPAANAPERCVHCGQHTFQTDDDGKPAHPRCTPTDDAYHGEETP